MRKFPEIFKLITVSAVCLFTCSYGGYDTMRSGLGRSVCVARTHGLGTSGRKTKDHRPARDVPVCIVLFTL